MVGGTAYYTGFFRLTKPRAIMHNPEIFEEPMKFRPERYLKDGKLNPDVLDSDDVAFGFGRR